MKEAGYLEVTSRYFRFNPVEHPMEIIEHTKFGTIKVLHRSIVIAIRVAVCPEVPSAFSNKLIFEPSEKIILYPMNQPLVTIEDPTAKKAKTNLQRRMPFSGPFSLSTENGPTCRNFVIPKEPVMMEMRYVMKNQVYPPNPLNTAQ